MTQGMSQRIDLHSAYEGEDCQDDRVSFNRDFNHYQESLLGIRKRSDRRNGPACDGKRQ